MSSAGCASLTARASESSLKVTLYRTPNKPCPPRTRAKSPGLEMRSTRRSMPSGVTMVNDSTWLTVGRPSGPAAFRAMLSLTEARRLPISRVAASPGRRCAASVLHPVCAWTSATPRLVSTRNTRFSREGSNGSDARTDSQSSCAEMGSDFMIAFFKPLFPIATRATKVAPPATAGSARWSAFARTRCSARCRRALRYARRRRARWADRATPRR